MKRRIYEFLCKLAGVPIHYCAETFANDCSLPSSIMKTLKRAMAGEYSRELGVKVIAGQKRLAELGFKQGAFRDTDFRRLLVSANRAPKQVLAHGERKRYRYGSRHFHSWACFRDRGSTRDVSEIHR